MMHETGPLTTASGALVADSQNSAQVGVGDALPLRGRTGLIRRRAAQALHTAGYAGCAALRRAAA
ncbi:hypothetical protein [Streptomyces sp. bgisy130]|uniref:hypothetical protein n=1 Tax=Streptomyces sp. bgisy130 TaxID=3413788 RepID=UPI003F49C11D